MALMQQGKSSTTGKKEAIKKSVAEGLTSSKELLLEGHERSGSLDA